MKTWSNTFLAALSLAAVFSLKVEAVTTHYVDAGGTSPVSPYTSWATAATNIQDAINHAIPGDTVLVTNGIYQSGGANVSSVSNRIYAAVGLLTIQSVNGPTVTVIKGHQVPGTTNGASAVRCASLLNATTLSGFTLTNGATINTGSGGGVTAGADCIITNCIITGNSASSSGGGVQGGKVFNCVITGNTAPMSSAGTGGGAAQSTLINCILTGNRSGYRGGGAFACTLVNCTVIGNTGQPDSLDGCTVRNSISYYNTPDNGEGSGDGNNFSNCCLSNTPYFGSFIVTNAPAFANLAVGDYHLTGVSPCINVGNNAYTTNNFSDFDSNPRIFGGTVDLGVYEFQSLVRYVNVSNTAPVAPFTNWLTAATNIQDAIDASSAGEFIAVSNGIYKSGGEVVYGSSSNRLVVNKAVTVQSVNGAAVTTIQGVQGLSAPSVMRCVYLTNGAALIGFSLTDGASRSTGDPILEESGGGVWCEGSSALVSNCVISGNAAAQYGGGVFRGTVVNCLLTNNSASRGGGGCSNLFINCQLLKNRATFQNIDSGGGAIYCTLTNCQLVANTCNGGGGGAVFSTLSSCVISNNSGISGAGISVGVADHCLISSNISFNSGGGAYSNTLTDCVLQYNRASNFGGGSYFGTLINCTVVSNTASQTGGGSYGGLLTNCIVYYNSAPKLPDYPNSSISSLNYCDATPLPTNGVGNITNDPAFVNFLGGDFHLQSNSPCINAGNNASALLPTDFDGVARIVGGTVDIGAYEFQSPGSLLSYAYLQQYGLPTDGSADNVDSDGDGMSNYAEWRAGTSPIDPTSLLQMTSAAPTNSSSATITWQSVSGVMYSILRSSDLTAFTVIQSNLVGQAGTTSYLDTTATGAGGYFYRVGVQ